ncbi:hypothetical protein GY45DRAFT_1410740 [Cubamyces sp. BRFM 1775]|nr:hypothetical protein GY45DRAFT_1410740 [Cubamyces sp. BRFM 1775]
MAPRRNAKKIGGVTCSYCGVVLAGDLARHERTHKAATIECSWPGCGRTFRQRANLRLHEEKWHLGVRRHACKHEWMNEFGEISACVATFDEPGGLTRHRKIMHGYNPDTPHQKDLILLRSAAKQAQDRQYYQAAAERSAARRQQSGAPPAEHGLPATSAAAAGPSTSRAPQAPRVYTPESTLASPSYAPGLAHPRPTIASSSYYPGTSSSGTRPSAPAFLHPSSSMRNHYANAAPANYNHPGSQPQSMYAPAPVQPGYPVLKQEPQVQQNFVGMTHPANMYNLAEVPMQYFEMPAPPSEFPEKSEFDMGWTMHDSLLPKPESPPWGSSAGWDAFSYPSAPTPGLSSGSSSPHSAGSEDWDYLAPSVRDLEFNVSFWRTEIP